MNDQSRSAEPNNPQVEAALRDYLERLDRGEPVDRDKFLADHAPIADELRSFIAAEDEVRKLAGAEAPLDRTYDSTKSFVGHGQETIVPQAAAKRAAESEGTGLAGRFGRYRIIRALGKGAMGTVYLAEDTQLERSVAIKTPHFTEDPTGEQTERFFREARAAGNLRHPNICPIHDFGQIDGRHYISMAYIEGRPLSAFIQPDKPLTERQILIVIRKLALALQEAHDRGIVHRDLKPANIMVDKKGEPIIMDFGLAQQTRRPGDIRLTQTGNIIGTPAYMSPEQVEGEPDKIGPPTDQYSLGAILYELLTGQLPFRGSVIAVMGQILTKEVSPPSKMRSDLDLRVEAVCLKMMAKTPSERLASLKAVADELTAILKSPAAKARSVDQRGQATQPNTTGGPVGTGAPAAARLSSPKSSATQSSADRKRADAGASQVLKSLKSKPVTESDLASLEELARKCYSRRDFDQVIQVVERIPEEKRTTGLAALLDKARNKADEISFLICEIDEAERLNDAPTALKKADALLAIKPGHHHALEVQEKYSGYDDGGAARIGVLDQFRRPLNDGGWIPWSVLAFGLAVVGVMTAVIVIYLRRTAVVIDIQNPGVEVAVKGTTLTITGPGQQTVKVVPGDQELTVSCAGFETITKKFSLKQGGKQTVTVSIVDSKLVARLNNENAPTEKEKEVVKTPSGAKGGAVAVPSPAAGSPEPNVATTASKFFLPSLLFGDWAIEGDELVQPNLDVRDAFKPGFVFGLNTLSNYDLTLEVKKTGGRNAMGIFFHWQSIGDYRRFDLAGNRELNFSYRSKGKAGRDQGEWKALNYASNQWYSLKVEARGATFRGYVDGVLQFERTDPRFTHGRIGLYTDGAAARFRRIKLCDPQGKVLLAGLPLLLPRRNKVAPKTDASETLPSLTAGETAAKSNQTEWAERLKTPVISTNSLGIKLALIPPGEFVMGSSKSEGGGVVERQHAVRLSKPFQIGVYEITQTEFEQVLGRNPSFFSNGGGPSEKATGPDTSRHPVEQVTWYDAVEFCNTLSQKEGRPPYYRIADIERDADGLIKSATVSVEGGGGYRLPTEAQWEYACRAGTTTPFNFGTANNGVECNCNGNSPEGTDVQGPSLRRTVPVGSYQPNAWGLYDMSGNVWEWCWDLFIWSYYEQSPKSDPAGPLQGSLRLNRGGGWNGGSKSCRSASRIGYAPEFRSNGTGFRIARDAADGEQFKPPNEASASAAPKSDARPDGFVPLFNGKDLTGWKTHPSQPGNWRVENGTLVGSGPGPTSHLYTERGDFKDFHLRVEARINKGGNSGVYYRTKFGPVSPARQPRWLVGYNAKLDENRLGAFLLDDAGPKGPLMVRTRVPQPPAARWVVLEVLVRGDHIVIKTDGEVTAEYTDKQRHFTSGYIALQQHTPQTRVEFRKVEIKELSPQSPSASVSDARADEQADAKLKSVTFAPNGGWAILYNENRFFARNIPDEALNKLTELAKQGAELKSVTFAPNGGWVILYNQNKYVAKNIPDEVLNKLTELARRGAELKSMTFSPKGGWAILYGKHGHSIRHISDEAFKKILELDKQDAELKSINFTPHDGWMILYNKNEYLTKRIPDAALKKLAELAKQGAELKSMTFTSHDGWAILYNKNEYFTRKIPDEAFTKLSEAKHGAERKSTDVKPGL